MKWTPSELYGYGLRYGFGKAIETLKRAERLNLFSGNYEETLAELTKALKGDTTK